jgi:hypothetical protein
MGGPFAWRMRHVGLHAEPLSGHLIVLVFCFALFACLIRHEFLQNDTEHVRLYGRPLPDQRRCCMCSGLKLARSRSAGSSAGTVATGVKQTKTERPSTTRTPRPQVLAASSPHGVTIMPTLNGCTATR